MEMTDQQNPLLDEILRTLWSRQKVRLPTNLGRLIFGLLVQTLGSTQITFQLSRLVVVSRSLIGTKRARPVSPESSSKLERGLSTLRAKTPTLEFLDQP